MKKDRQKELLAHCGEIQEDDCVDPKIYFQKAGRSQKEKRKSLQLCKQVKESLQLSIGQFDSALTRVDVVDVEPAPDSRRMQVSLTVDLDQRDKAAIENVLAALDKNYGRLRSEIARSIHRKKTPNLCFQIVNRQTERGSDQ